MMVPIWDLLKSRQNDGEWNPACRGGLRSAFSGRQYPQVRVFAAGWSEHNRGLCCLNDLAVAEALNCGCSIAPASREQNLEAKQVVATAKQIAEAPIGNLNHSIWGCQSEPMQHERKKRASKQDVQQEAECDVS